MDVHVYKQKHNLTLIEVSLSDNHLNRVNWMPRHRTCNTYKWVP